MKFDTIQLCDIDIEVLDGDRGKNYPHQDELLKTGDCLFLSAKNVTKNGFSFTEKQFITKEKDKLLNNGRLKRGDIVITTRGTVGNVALYSNEICYDKIRINSGMLIIRCGDKIDNYYLYQVLRSKWFQNQILSTQSGSAQPQLPKSHFHRMTIPVPVVNTQHRIASILSSIDEKIVVNTAINENLEQQAQAIFKSWFVDFEPFGGVLPDDWQVTTLGNIAKICTKSINPLKQPELYLEHYSIPSYDEQHYPIFEYASEIKSNKYILTKDSVMISKLNPNTKRIWRPLCLSDKPVCSTEFIVYEAVNSKHKDYIYSLIDSQEFSDFLCAHTTGSTNSRQRATPKTTLDFSCVLPTEDIISQFCGIVTPIYDRIGTNLIENQRLAGLRDTLLPKLMSGEIDISQVKI